MWRSWRRIRIITAWRRGRRWRRGKIITARRMGRRRMIWKRVRRRNEKYNQYDSISFIMFNNKINLIKLINLIKCINVLIVVEDFVVNV